MSESTYLSTWLDTEHPLLQPCCVHVLVKPLDLRLLSQFQSHNGQHLDLNLQLLRGEGPILILMGCDWLKVLKLDWPTLFTLLPVVFSFLTGCVGQTYYSFQGVVGYSQGSGSEIKFKARCYSSFSSFLLKSVLNEIKGGSRVGERRDLTWKTRGNWTSAFSQKAVPIVSVYKSDRNVRICRNYKLTINRESETDWYLLPKQRDHFSILSGVKTSHNLIRLALTSNWCWKISSRDYTTINTAKGLFHYKRLRFGIASAPSTFQWTLENALQGIPNVCAYLDDVMATGSIEAGHLRNLEAILSKTETAEVRLKKKVRLPTTSSWTSGT